MLLVVYGEVMTQGQYDRNTNERAEIYSCDISEFIVGDDIVADVMDILTNDERLESFTIKRYGDLIQITEPEHSDSFCIGGYLIETKRPKHVEWWHITNIKIIE